MGLYETLPRFTSIPYLDRVNNGFNKYRIVNKEIVSKQFTLEWRDILKGLVMAALTPAIVIMQQSIDAGVLTFNWKAIGMAAVGGGFAYLVKNFLEPTKIVEIKQVKKKPVYKSDEEIGI